MFPHHLLFLLEFPEFLVNSSLFENSTIAGNSGTFVRKFPYHLFPHRKIWEFWINWKSFFDLGLRKSPSSCLVPVATSSLGQPLRN